MWQPVQQGAAERLTVAIARARRVLDRVAGTDAYHARLVAERLTARWGAAELPACELLASSAAGSGTELRATLAGRLSAHAGSPIAAGSLVALLRSDRELAARTCEELDAAVRQVAADGAGVRGVVEGGLGVLASRALAVLELRALGERRSGDPHPTWIDAEREHWAAVAAGEQARRVPRALAPRAALLPLAKHVVLVAASDLRASASLAWTLESRGATTILAEGERIAREMLRLFEVDAIIATLAGGPDPMVALPRVVRELRARPPLMIAVVPPPGRTVEGFDVSVPLDPEDAGTLGGLLGAAITARADLRR